MLRTLLFLPLCLALCASAQTVTGTLEGHVTDPSGAVIPGAKITAKNGETGLTRTTETNSTGYYQLTFLPVGDYRVTAESQGFGTVARDAIVSLNSSLTADFQLKPATVATEVTVEADAALIETSRGELKSTIDEKTIEDRPLASRNILSLVEMLPGFQSTSSYSGVNNPTLSSGSYVSFNGTGSRSATFQVDGVNNDDSSEGTNRQNVNVSAIKEFQVLTNAYSAEFGRAGGAIILVQTKSGTNALHGDAYEFFQNQVLNSNGFFNNASGRRPDGSLIAPRAPYRRNQFGFTAGGPIIRNKLFLFHSFEQTRLIQYNTFRRWIFLPTDKLQIGDCRTCLNPEQHPNLQADMKFLQGILDRFPKVAPNDPNSCDHCYVETKRASYPDQDYSGKLDWNPGNRDTVAVRYQYSRQRRQPFPLIQGETAFQNNRQQNVGLTHTHMWNALTWGEFRFGLGLRTTLVDIADGNTTPIVRITNPTAFTTTTMGSAGQYPINRFQTDYQAVYNLSRVWGRNIVRVGVDYRKQALDDLADNYSRGWWTFGNVGVRGQPTFYEGWENFLRGYATGFERGYGNFTTLNRLGESNQYIQDDFKVKPNLTLNFGLRTELVFAPSETQGKVRYPYDQFLGWEPRFGFAWSPNFESDWLRRLAPPGRVSVRGGFGIFHNRIFQSVFSQGGASLRSLPPYGLYRTFDPTFNVADPSNGFVYTPGPSTARYSPVFVDPNLAMPTIQQYNITIERQFAGKTTVSVSYQRTRGIGLLQNQSLNRARFPFTDPLTGILYDKIDPNLANTAPAPGFISLAQPRTNNRRPDARYLGVTQIANGSWSYYNGFRLEVVKRYSKGLQMRGSYAWSKAIDTGSDITAGVTITENGAAASNRGLSDFDQRHRATLNYSYELPWFRKTSSPGLARYALGGWTLSGTHIFSSGNPFTVSMGYDYNADGVANDRALLVDQSLFGASIDNGRTNPATGVQYSVEQFPLSAFFPNVNIPQAQRAFDPGGSGKGTLGRNTFFGAGIKNWDLGIYKSFPMPWERGQKLTFRAEMYNVTNTPRFALPTRSIQSLAFGRITGTYNPMNFVGASRTDDTSRVVQLALRFTF